MQGDGTRKGVRIIAKGYTVINLIKKLFQHYFTFIYDMFNETYVGDTIYLFHAHLFGITSPTLSVIPEPRSLKDQTMDISLQSTTFILKLTQTK